jgi:hypothetical protein
MRQIWGLGRFAWGSFPRNEGEKMATVSDIYAELFTCSGVYPFRRNLERFENYSCLRSRLDVLWKQHNAQFGNGMTVILKNQWSEDELFVVVAEPGWLLELRAEGKSTRFVPGNIRMDTTVEFLTFEGQPCWLDGKFGDFLTREKAESLIELWLEMGQI